MMIDWNNILINSGIFTSVIAVLELVRSWKNKKRTENAEAKIKEAEATKSIIDTWKDYAQRVQKDTDEYRSRTDAEIAKLKEQMAKLEERDRIKEAALSKGWRCNNFQLNGECPILDSFVTDKN